MLDTACGNDESPIMGELNLILGVRGLHEKDVVLIDDIRTFRGSRLDNNMHYPELTELQDYVCEFEEGELLFYVEDDIARVHRARVRDGELETIRSSVEWNEDGVLLEARSWKRTWAYTV
jgi:hypothetical protein